MQINTNYSVGPLPTVAYAKSAAGRQNTSSDTNFLAKEQLDAQLAQTPDVRTESVARAASLIRSANYPGADQLKRLASHLAESLNPDATSPKDVL